MPCSKTFGLAKAKRGKLACAIGLSILCFSAISAAQPLGIGRSALTLPDQARWDVREVEAINPTYSGDRSGAIPMGAKHLTYRSVDGRTKAIFIPRVTRGGVGEVRMSWSNDCVNVNPEDFLYKNDKSSSHEVDCLLVASISLFATFLNAMPQLKKDTGDTTPHTSGGYYVQYSKSLGAGGYAFTQALIASDFKGIENTAKAYDSRISVGVLAWAEAFAKNNRDAVGSFTGNWSIPPLVFNQQ